MPLLVYMTTASKEEAEYLATELVEQGLAAGVNILAPVTSVYRWKGAVCKAGETILLAQTEEDRLDALKKRVLELHSYEVPCIIALPITHGTDDFLRWIQQSTRPEALS